MQLRNLQVENVKSFRWKEDVPFDQGYNILVGPNGGGKSNLLDIVTISLNQFFFKSVNEQTNDRGRRLLERTPFSNLDQRLEKYIGDSRESNIEITLEVSLEDIQNLEALLDNRDELEKRLDRYYQIQTVDSNLGFMDEWDPTALSPGDRFDFQIKDNSLAHVGDMPKQMILQYLQGLETFVLQTPSIEDLNLRPSYFYFSPYRGAIGQSKEVQLHSSSYQDLVHNYLGSTSRDQASALHLAVFRLAEKKREIEAEARGDPADVFSSLPEVELIDSYLNRLGFEWSLPLRNKNQNRYELVLERPGKTFSVGQLSSGEAEVINFLFAILSTNIQNGIIVIDEPELHLHPRWQSVLLDLFSDLHSLTGNQFIFTTHSPSFITKETISSVKRVNKDSEDSSRTTSIDERDLSDASDLIHVINSENNEKMFFADEVVLVEGVSDQIVFEKLLSELQKDDGEPRVYEVLEVSGKNNFSKYTELLENLGVPYNIIADRDFARELGNDLIGGLFDTSMKKVERKVLKDAKSLDAGELARKLDSAIESGDLDDLQSVRKLWRYIRSQQASFRGPQRGCPGKGINPRAATPFPLATGDPPLNRPTVPPSRTSVEGSPRPEPSPIRPEPPPGPGEET